MFRCLFGDYAEEGTHVEREREEARQGGGRVRGSGEERVTEPLFTGGSGGDVAGGTNETRGGGGGFVSVCV